MQESKLKFSELEMMIFTLSLIGAILLATLIFGQLGFAWAFSVVQILMFTIHFVVLIRTKNPVYFIPTGMYGLWSLTFFPPLANSPLHEVFAVISVFFLVGFIWVLATKKINWRYREILELAAKPVTDASDGFTSRPFVSGQANFSRNEALGLARFLLKHVICFPIIEAERIVLVIPRVMWVYLLGFRRSYEEATYVALAKSGEIIVRIAQSDYQKFKNELTFDQLCQSLGELFKQFLQHYQEGEPRKIIHKLNSI
ncbi:MAG: hypothetical protein B5M54_09325 [Candidatus Aminicenantes bacterium 4484_214]|nr:MAG: hypothetical protein B5M54_09325 [Candidatus Aminicenantes bacterium 4484_214]